MFLHQRKPSRTIRHSEQQINRFENIIEIIISVQPIASIVQTIVFPSNKAQISLGNIVTRPERVPIQLHADSPEQNDKQEIKHKQLKNIKQRVQQRFRG